MAARLAEERRMRRVGRGQPARPVARPRLRPLRRRARGVWRQHPADAGRTAAGWAAAGDRGVGSSSRVRRAKLARGPVSHIRF